METYIALLRGINVGGKNSLPMKDLRSYCEELNFRESQTYIQSGNLLFRTQLSDKQVLMEEISGKIKKEKGFSPELMLLTAEEWIQAVKASPYSLDKGKKIYLYFLARCPSDPDMDKIKSLRKKSENFLLKGKVFYLFAPEGIGRSRLAASVESSLGVSATARNGNTLQKISALLETY